MPKPFGPDISGATRGPAALPQRRPRNNDGAKVLLGQGIGTLRLDLRTPGEDLDDPTRFR